MTMRKPRAEMGPVFKRVLRCFDSQAEYARQIGLKDRRHVREWIVKRGYIPLRWALVSSIATEGKISAQEIITETARIMERRAIERQVLREAANRALAEEIERDPPMVIEVDDESLDAGAE